MKKLFIIYIISLILFSSMILNANQLLPKSVNGVLDLSNWDFEKDKPLIIKGEWEFYYNKLLTHDNVNSHTPDLFITDIGFFGKSIFENLKIDNKIVPKEGYATYRLKIKYQDSNNKLAIKLFDIASAYKLFLNGEEIASSGKVGTSLETSIGHYNPQIISFKAEKEIELILQISTYHQHLSFLNNRLIIGYDEQIRLREAKYNFEDIFSFGVLFVLSIYYLIVHLFYDKNQDNSSSFYFSLLCLVMSIRILFSGFRYILTLFPNMPLNFMLSVNYLTYYQGVSIFALMVSSVFPNEFSKKILSVIIKFSFIASIIVIITPPRIFGYTLPFFQIFTLFIFPYILSVLFKAAKNKREGAKVFLVGMSIYAVFIINDLLYINGLLQTTLLTNYGLFIFIFSNSLVVTKKYIDFIIDTSMKMAFENMEKKRIQGIFEKYVSPEVVADLVNSDLESELGGQEKVISILFSDIENFTTFAEQFPPNEIVLYLNNYFNSMIEILHRNCGILDKFIGDAIMGLFGTPLDCPNHADFAVKTAIEMKNKVKEISEVWKEKIDQKLKVRIGINTGEVIVGNIGSKKRMEYTAIGDNVNLASRLEDANKFFGTNIIISKLTYDQLENPSLYLIRELDNVRVYGKKNPVQIFEVIDYDTDEEARLFVQKYTDALTLYHNRQFKKALKIFKSMPDDRTSKIYVQRCIEFITFPPKENWDKVYEVAKSPNFQFYLRK